MDEALLTTAELYATDGFGDEIVILWRPLGLQVVFVSIFNYCAFILYFTIQLSKY